MESCQRTLRVFLLLGLVVVGRASDSAADEPPESARQPVEIGVDRRAHDRERPASGDANQRAGERPFVASDVVILVDSSTLALVASGIDVDQDGVVGRNRSEATERRGILMPAQFWTTDSGDTIHALQLRVAEAVVLRLAARENQVGLTSYTVRVHRQRGILRRSSNKSEILVPVGAPDAVLSALVDFPKPHEYRRTDLSRLLERGAQLLDAAASNVEARRPRAIILLYIGEPSAPDGIHWSSSAALERADELGERGIAVWGIPLRPGVSRFLDELTRRSGGQVIPLDQLDGSLGTL